MATLQIIYLIVNIIGITFGLAWYLGATETVFISDFFTFVSKRLGNIGLIFISFFMIILFLPALTTTVALITFIMILGTYSK